MIYPASTPPSSIDLTKSITLPRRDRLLKLLDGYGPLRQVYRGEILDYPTDSVSETEGVKVALWCPRRNAGVATAGGSSVTMPGMPTGAYGKTEIEVYLALSIVVHLSEKSTREDVRTAYNAGAALSDAFLLALIAHISDPTTGGRLWHKLELLPQTTDFSRQENKGPLRSDTYMRLHSQMQNP